MSLTHSDIKIAEEVTSEILKGLKVKLTPEVKADAEGFKINLVGKDTAIVIGYHGETLADLAYIISLVLRRKIDKNFSVRVDAGEYLKNKDKRIEELASRAIDKVKRSGFPEYLSGLNSYERRVVHALVTKEGLLSESSGYGKERRLVIKPS
jgi:spoIIIJ-associated protein